MKPKIPIDCLDTAQFTCPKCLRQKTMQLSEYDIRKQQTQVNCKCRCGYTYAVILERSMDSIAKTRLSGTYTSQGDVRCSGKIMIEKLNSQGVMFKTNGEPNILPGLKLSLEFVLDDAKQSIVKKEVVVKAKKGKYLSAEFLSTDHNDNLGPYLSFNKLIV